MSEQRDTIDTRLRGHADLRTATAPPWRASQGARVLARVPLVSTTAAPRHASEQSRAGARNKYQTQSAPTGSASTPASTTTLRLDAAHRDSHGPHTAAPEWLDRPSGFVAALNKRKSLIVAAILVGGTIGYLVHHSHAQRAKLAGKTAPAASTVHTEHDRRARHKAPVAEANAVAAETELPAAQANTPASIDAPRNRVGASAAANQPAETIQDDVFEIHDSPAGAREPARQDHDGPSAAVEIPTREVFRTARRDVGPAAPNDGEPAGVARFGGTLNRYQAQD